MSWVQGNQFEKQSSKGGFVVILVQYSINPNMHIDCDWEGNHKELDHTGAGAEVMQLPGGDGFKFKVVADGRVVDLQASQDGQSLSIMMDGFRIAELIQRDL